MLMGVVSKDNPLWIYLLNPPLISKHLSRLPISPLICGSSMYKESILVVCEVS
jgi:hypothetical protein